MKKISCALLGLTVAASLYAQKSNDAFKQKLGIKGGYNWSYVTGEKEGFNTDNKSGFLIGAFYSPATSTGRGFRSEIVFSRQGYSFENGGQNTDVLNDYIYLPQLATFNVGKFLQLQAGGQVGFLLQSKLSGAKDSLVTDLMNRVDYGFAAGVELSPTKGLLIGGRYNLGLGKLYKRYEQSATNPNPYPLPFNPETTNLRNGVVQFFVGIRL